MVPYGVIMLYLACSNLVIFIFVSERQICTKNVEGVKMVVLNFLKILKLETTQRFILFTFMVFGVRAFVEGCYKDEMLDLGFPKMWYTNVSVVGTIAGFAGNFFSLKI